MSGFLEEAGLKEDRGEDRGLTMHLIQHIDECMSLFFAERNIYFGS